MSLPWEAVPLSRLGEKILIETALKHTGGRKGEAAELLGWGRNTLTRKLKTLLPEMAEE
ncbi:helix-turn-helix domain-containing protein [Halomonas nitroreducens]|uniref:helix-turn-helix domain-containing protein n=1 Tax=Halomonas nitroreducens TaxID=447425 RepID=UPI001639E16C|nr:helix-turn-helix domain-containing protein [Halomonas nitroreducens]